MIRSEFTNPKIYGTLRLLLSAPAQHTIDSEIRITGSKSESNRLLLLKSLFPNIQIENLSNSDDSRLMEKGLEIKEGTVDIHHAGTAMRFLTAFFASNQDADVVLTGSERMQQRPIKILVEALQNLGADISYVQNEGYPPIRIRGKKLENSRTSLPANVSSQYISALLLVAPALENGIELELIGEITSVPYIKMTCSLLSQLGIDNSFEGNTIRVSACAEVEGRTMVVESDWSAASYFYSILALSPVGSKIRLSAYKKDSLQGDSVLAEIYQELGVKTSYGDNYIDLEKKETAEQKEFNLNLVNAPDLAQTIAVSCFGLGAACNLTGLHTLKIKETDRLEAMKTELSKLGANISVTNESLHLKPSSQILEGVSIDTYHDHRMAMAFAPLALKCGLAVNDADVVSKSYPDYWKDLQTLGFEIKEDL